MSSVLIHNARILTLAEGSVPRRGAEANNLSVIERGFIRLDGDCVSAIGEGEPAGELFEPSSSECESHDDRAHVTINAHGRVVMPAFIDAHTHACWAGDRLDEWDMKRAGKSYLDILNAGGGIMSTVRAVRGASEDDLSAALQIRAAAMANAGTLCAEVKTGYGLSTASERLMWNSINDAQASIDAPSLYPTLLLGHAIDPDVPDFIDHTIHETLPTLCAEIETPGVVDAYCEEGAWSVEDCQRLFERAQSLDWSFRVHADQFNSLGMTPLAVEMGAISVDHLEASTEKDLKTLAESVTFGVMLPACAFHLDDRYAHGRLFMDMGGALVIASNWNPGSAPCFSMPFVISLAVRKLGLTVQEAITACTINAKALLNANDAFPGMRSYGRLKENDCFAQFIMLRHTDERMLAYEFGGDPVQLVVSDGRILKWTGDDSTRTIIKP